MPLPRILKAFALCLACCTGLACAQTFPTKPIRIITAEPGGVSDFAGRIMANGMSASMGQPVIVDNRGGGAVTGPMMTRAAPDGYTLLYNGNNVWLLPFMQNVAYDPVKDLTPVTQVGTSPNMLVVNPALAAKSVKELIALAKAKPGELNFATNTTGTAIHLAGELFKSMANINIVRISYKATAQAVNEVVAGRVEMMFPNTGSGSAMVKAGKLRALALTSAQPSPLMPELPTIAATGLPGYEAVAMTTVFAPAKTPPAIIRRLNQEIVQVLLRPDIKEKLFNSGVEVVAGTPEAFAAVMKADMARFGKVIKDAGIRAE